eukprot:TRINITY_DN25604_c0_g1_i4.p1 TRINITY_DN25604_c0_g1~~TRINITY_DN25604_c0_g1_i4.p1  ORF type:complete len:235 (+),score=79.69 TRINITY_DN25604_c0_g1_i4:43-747(+)
MSEDAKAKELKKLLRLIKRKKRLVQDLEESAETNEEKKQLLESKKELKELTSTMAKLVAETKAAKAGAAAAEAKKEEPKEEPKKEEPKKEEPKKEEPKKEEPKKEEPKKEEPKKVEPKPVETSHKAEPSEDNSALEEEVRKITAQLKTENDKLEKLKDTIATMEKECDDLKVESDAKTKFVRELQTKAIDLPAAKPAAAAAKKEYVVVLPDAKILEAGSVKKGDYPLVIPVKVV